MAVYELQVYAISSNADLHTVLRSKIPAKLDARMWADDYTVITGNDFDSGVPTTRVSVRFNAEADRTTIASQIDALAGFKVDCEIGSYIKKHLCYHDEGKPCETAVILWEKE